MFEGNTLEAKNYLINTHYYDIEGRLSYENLYEIDSKLKFHAEMKE